MNAITTNNGSEIMEAVIAKGDLARLTPEERNRYYLETCRSLNLNPLTIPFQYITLNGKMVLYATKACTEQLRSIHKVSVEDLTESERDGVFIVTAKVRNAEGRTDMAKGAVMLGSLKGEALANGIMKAETKAKRRATLSICGLGMLDESEIETIPGAAATIQRPTQAGTGGEPANSTPPMKAIGLTASPPAVQAPADPETGEVSPHIIAVTQTADGKPDFRLWASTFIAAVKASTSIAEANAWADLNAVPIASLKQYAPRMYTNMMSAIGKHRETLEPEAVEFEDNLAERTDTGTLELISMASGGRLDR